MIPPNQIDARNSNASNILPAPLGSLGQTFNPQYHGNIPNNIINQTPYNTQNNFISPGSRMQQNFMDNRERGFQKESQTIPNFHNNVQASPIYEPRAQPLPFQNFVPRTNMN